MDTTHLEYTAEDLISHKLMQAGILVAKPKFDREGTDLLAFVQMTDGVKFCRIQCKGRWVGKADSNIKIPISYVTNGFVVFLYAEDGLEVPGLYCFFASEIRAWNTNPTGDYQLSIAKTNFREKLRDFQFDNSKVEIIRALIKGAEASGEFQHLVRGYIDATLGGIEMRAYGKVTPPD